MEVVGLVIIVLLILTGIFLLVYLGKPNPDRKAAGYNQKLAESFVSSLPDVKIECGTQHVAYKEFVRACALNSDFSCMAIQWSSPVNTSCGVLKGVTSDILTNSLKKWHYDYTFEIRRDLPPSQSIFSLNNPADTTTPPGTTVINACKAKKRKVTATQPIPLATSGGNPAMIQLQLCY